MYICPMNQNQNLIFFYSVDKKFKKFSGDAGSVLLISVYYEKN